MPHRDPAFGRFPAGDKTPAWLRHPSLTGLEPAAFDDLVARYRTWCTGHPPVLLPGKRPDGGPGAGGRRLSAADHLVVFLLKNRWSMTQAPLAEATGLSKNRIGATLREAAPVLAALGYVVPTGGLTVTSTEQLAAIAGCTSPDQHTSTRSRYELSVHMRGILGQELHQLVNPAPLNGRISGLKRLRKFSEENWINIVQKDCCPIHEL